MGLDLRSVYEETMVELKTQVVDLPWESSDFYAHWLAQSYYFVSHSTRLLGAAMSRISASEAAIHRRMADHIQEEAGHERLAQMDLLRLGRRMEQFEELELTKAFYGYQYYCIDRGSPWSFFGYILFLEGLAVKAGPRIQSKISKAYPSKSTAFIRVHVQEDVSHVEELFRLILDLSPSHREDVHGGFLYAKTIYGKLLRGLRDAPPKSLPKQSEVTCG